MGMETITTLALGDDFACALLSNDTVKCWGDNSLGQFGSGTLLSNTMAVQGAITTAGTPLTGIRDIEAGHRHACAVTNSNEVYCWGQLISSSGQDFAQKDAVLMGLSSAYQVSAGSDHSCAVAGSNEEVYCWGSNEFEQLGQRNREFTSVPFPVAQPK
jgi:alpha-tubulin suppressor-like RCC1 family protein